MTQQRQPFLHDAEVILRAPVQWWASVDGEVDDRGIHGVYVGDVRVLRTLRLRVDGTVPEHIATAPDGADAVRIDALLRGLDDPSPDPGVRLVRHRRVDVNGGSERITVVNRQDVTVATTLRLVVEPDAAGMDAVKAGERPEPGPVPAVGTDGVVRWRADDVSVAVGADGATIAVIDGRVVLDFAVVVPPAASTSVAWWLAVNDPTAVVVGAAGPVPWRHPVVDHTDHRVARWLDRALQDLDALRMVLPALPQDTFIAAGAPWFLTLFGRDSIWTARMLLPLGTDLAGATLRVLASMQGEGRDDATAEEPGRILHELRRAELRVESDGIVLPPRYYGTVDATPLWAVLLHDAWRAGLADAEVVALLPHLERAIAWLLEAGDADGDGFVEYLDRSGRGLSNQGWKDSGDSVRWHDGSIATGPIALCEVQGYVYGAFIAAAELLEAFERPGGHELRVRAAALRARFREAFWVDGRDGLGPYPAIALDGAKRPVDAVASNMGHLLGTGLLDPHEERLVADRLLDPRCSSGFGLRTMASDEGGFWPLSYHCGSVWTHDTAIVIDGLRRAGLHDHAARLADGLLAAAESFGWRMPELHSGDGRDVVGGPVPYPASCRPQAWSAAAAVVVADALGALR